jgi:hypothetical protein
MRNKRRPKATMKRRRRLLPVLRPAQNMRDIIKQLAMLEDHLFHPEKRCTDCIRKHFLTIEGLAEECVTLCKPALRESNNVVPQARKVATTARILHHAWETAPKDPRLAEAVAARLRKLRKCLMQKYSRLPLDKLPTKETNAVNAFLNHLNSRK